MLKTSLTTLALLLTLTACSESDRQQVTQQVSHKAELDKAKAVEKTINEKAAADLKLIEAQTKGSDQ